MTPFLAVERLSVGEFATLREEWRVLHTCAGGDVFQAWEWLHPWRRHLGRGELMLLALRRRGDLIAIAPLFRSTYFGLPLRRLMLLGCGITDRLGIVAEPAAEARTAAYLLDYLMHAASPREFIDLHQLPADAPLLAAPTPAGCRELRFPQEACPFVALPATWDEFTARLGKRMRENVAYYPRRLAREFRVEIDVADTAGVAAAVDDFIRLHQARWRARGLPGALGGARLRAFHHAAAPLLLERGWLRLYTLRLDGEAAASLYCLEHDERVAYYLGGMDPRYARFSLGTVLTAHAMRDAIERGAREFDFLRGDEAYKLAWGAAIRWQWRRLLWRDGPLNAILPRLIAIEREAEQAIKRWAGRR